MNCDFQDHPTDPNKLQCPNCLLTIPIRFKGRKVVSTCRKLSALQKVGKYTTAFINHSVTGFKKTPPNALRIRQEVCDSCRHLGPNKECLYCGCNTQKKMAWQEQTCPMEKWPKYFLPEGQDHMPLLFKLDKNDKDIPVNLEGLYRGATCFFIGGGPSLNNLDPAAKLKLSNPNILKFGVNNIAARDFNCQLWTSADDPLGFHENIWRNPCTLKFVRRNNYFKPIRTGEFVRNMPGTLFFDINEDFDSSTFLTEPTINFGNHGKTFDELGNKGGRSAMLIAMRLMYYLGFTNIYLLGCDFWMNVEKPYAFEQMKHKNGCDTNNDKFRELNERFELLQPRLLSAGCMVKNCTPDSKLTAFPYKDLLTVLGNQETKYDPKCSLANMYGGRTD